MCASWPCHKRKEIGVTFRGMELRDFTHRGALRSQQKRRPNLPFRVTCPSEGSIVAPVNTGGLTQMEIGQMYNTNWKNPYFADWGDVRFHGLIREM